VVFDASVVLALLNHEPGAERVTLELVSRSSCSTVNLAEVQTKLVNAGAEPGEAWEDALSAVGEAVPFTREQARIAGSLVTQTRAMGLSLGDRACIALGLALKAPVYTADRSWKNLRLGVRMHAIR
jgi:PIN domain nuclease of toxin-antitoxin system